MTSIVDTEQPDDLPRRWPDENLFSTAQAVMDVAPTAVPWIHAVAAAQANDDDTLLRVLARLRRMP